MSSISLSGDLKANSSNSFLAPKLEWLRQILELKVEHGVTKTKEVASQVPTRSLATAQHLGNFALAGAGFGTGVMMNAKSHFQNAGSFFTRKEPSQPEPVMPSLDQQRLQ